MLKKRELLRADHWSPATGVSLLGEGTASSHGPRPLRRSFGRAGALPAQLAKSPPHSPTAQSSARHEALRC
jgi:hypothetical protein